MKKPGQSTQGRSTKLANPLLRRLEEEAPAGVGLRDPKAQEGQARLSQDEAGDGEERLTMT